MVGGYRIQARLGSGGMGRVYLASTPAGRPVALKIVRSELGEDPNFRTRFRREIEAAQRVHGLYTAQLVDADPDATPPWLVTTYVPGPSLEEAIEHQGPMPEAMVFRLIAGVAEALAAIHAADVVHRDLKPSNVLLASDGPRVIDFGIAQAQEATSLTRSDVMMGSPDFLSPEQVLDLPITPAIDVFALGSIAVYAAVGRPPFGYDNIMAVAHRVVHEPPDLTGCPAQLLTLIEACLEKQAKDRPSPGQIIEFCVTRAATTADSSQPWLAWSMAAAAPGVTEVTEAPGVPGGGAESFAAAVAAWPDSAGRATAQTVNFARGLGGNADEGLVSPEWPAGGGKPPRRRLPFGVAVAAAAALVAAAVVALVVATHLAASGKTALGNAARSVTATSHPVTPTGSATFGASPSAPSSTSASARARGHGSPSPSPARSKSTASAPDKPVVLLSQGRPVTTSSIEGYPWAAANAVDGNLTTRWSSGWSDPQWLKVDLGASYNLHKVVLYWENAYATAFQIQVSDNGSTWTDLQPTISGFAGKQSLTVSGTGRYVRMYGTHRSTQYGYSLYEFQVFGN
jgi:eukaryotic-like serine/threonine-protein kinase